MSKYFQLHKQAGFTDFSAKVLNGVKNLPKNIAGKTQTTQRLYNEFKFSENLLEKNPNTVKKVSDSLKNIDKGLDPSLRAIPAIDGLTETSKAVGHVTDKANVVANMNFKKPKFELRKGFKDHFKKLGMLKSADLRAELYKIMKPAAIEKYNIRTMTDLNNYSALYNAPESEYVKKLTDISQRYPEKAVHKILQDTVSMYHDPGTVTSKRYRNTLLNILLKAKE